MVDIADLFDSQSGGASGSGSTISMVASGAITAGDRLAVNADGTVSTVTGVEYSEAVGSLETFLSASLYELPHLVYDSVNDKVVMFYHTSTSEFVATVGTVSGTSITWETPVVVRAAACQDTNVAYDPVNGVISIVYSYSNVAYAHMCTVSGTTITVGSAQTIYSGSINSISSCYHQEEDRWVFAYVVSNATKLKMASLSGTTLTLGSEVAAVGYSGGYGVCVAYHEAAKCCIMVARYITSPYRGIYWCFTVDDLIATYRNWGIFTQYTTSSSYFDCLNPKLIYNSKEEMMYCVYNRPSGTSAQMTPLRISDLENFTIRPNLSGTSNVCVYASWADGIFPNVAYDPSTNTVAGADQGSSNNNFRYKLQPSKSINWVQASSGVVPTTTKPVSTLNTGTYFLSSDINGGTICWTGVPGQFITAFEDDDDGDYGKTVIATIPSTQTNADKYVGIATETVADGDDIVVAIIGAVAENQSGLIPGNRYELAFDGSLKEAEERGTFNYPDKAIRNNGRYLSDYAFVGTALTPTSIFLGEIT